MLAQPALALQLLSRHADPRGSEEQAEDQPHDDEARSDPSLVLAPSAPSDADLRRARPRVVLHLHVSDSSLRAGDGLVRPEHGDPLTLDQVHEWLADTGCAVTVRPVVDPVETAPVDAYETPHRLRDALFLRNPVRTGGHNLGPLTRSHRRAVTFAGWRRHQPDPGTYVFRSPHGYVFLVTNQGTLGLGRSSWTDAFWALTAARAAGSGPFATAA